MQGEKMNLWELRGRTQSRQKLICKISVYESYHAQVKAELDQHQTLPKYLCCNAGDTNSTPPWKCYFEPLYAETTLE